MKASIRMQSLTKAYLEAIINFTILEVLLVFTPMGPWVPLLLLTHNASALWVSTRKIGSVSNGRKMNLRTR